MFAGETPATRTESPGLAGTRSVPHSHDKAPWPVGCHQTIKANIRFHLYGGPQVWNPHSFGPERNPRQAINPSESVRPETTFAFPRTPRYYLRASNPARSEQGRRHAGRQDVRVSAPGDPERLVVVRITSYRPLLLKGIEPSPERVQAGRRRHASATREPGGPIVVRIPPKRSVTLKGVEPSPGGRRFERDEGASISGVGYTEPPHVVRIPSECRGT